MIKLALSVNRSLVFILCAGSIFAYTQQITDSHIIAKWIFVGIIVCIIGLYNSVLIISGNGDFKENVLLLESISILCLVQAIYGILQYFGLLPSYFPHEITGSFDNPAGFAICLCAGLPFTGFLLLNNNRLIRCAGWVSGIIMVAAVILSGSRAGIVSITVAGTVFMFQKLNQKRYVWKYVLLVGAIFLFVGCYWLKKDSADGRLLIWQCSMNMIKDAPLLGHGIGRFEACYMDYQAEYFKVYGMNRFSMLADNVKHPFNEYLGVLLNWGIVGLLMLAALVILLVCSYRENPDNKKRIAAYVLFIIGTFSLFSYPFIYPFTWITTLLGIYLIMRDRINIFFALSGVRNIICIIIFICSLVGMYKLSERTQAELDWNEMSNLSLVGKYEEVLPGYKILENVYAKDPYFLYNYAAILMEAKQYKESLELALQCRHYWADYDLELMIGENYQHLNQPELAETYYSKASMMCPSRFLPLYKLFHLYKEANEERQMLNVAQTIIDKPMKIKAPTILMMKREMKREKAKLSNELTQ